MDDYYSSCEKKKEIYTPEGMDGFNLSVRKITLHKRMDGLRRKINYD